MRAKKKVKEYVKILERKRKKGTTLYLLYTLPNGTRKQEATGLMLVDSSTPEGKAQNEITRKAVEKLKAERTAEIVGGKFGIETSQKDKNKVLLVDYIRNLQTSSKKAIRTKKQYLALANQIQRYSANTMLCDVNKKWLLSYIDFMEDLKATSIKQYCILLNAVLTQAVKEKLIVSNAYSELSKEQKPKAKQAKREYLAIEELERVVANFPQNTDKQKNCLKMFLFGCYTGLRFSDIEKIKWEDLKKDASNGKYYFDIEMQKTKEIVKGYLSKKTLEVIGEPTGLKGNIFMSVTPMFINDCIKRSAKMAGVDKNICFHTSRHTFAVNLLAGGMDIYSVSRLLGHTDIKTTQIYLEMMPKKQIEAADLIDKIF